MGIFGKIISEAGESLKEVNGGNDRITGDIGGEDGTRCCFEGLRGDGRCISHPARELA